MPEWTPFKLERYFARFEFNTRYLWSASDCESLSLKELLALADLDSLRLWDALSLGYTESAGLPVLREEIAHFYPSLTPENMLVLAPEEGIFIAMQSLLQPGDQVITLFPAYQSLAEVARSIGCEVKNWELKPSRLGWQLDLQELENLITNRTRLLVINFPHNPTGFLPTQIELEAILEIARRFGLNVFSDEMYRLLEYDPARRLPPVCSMYENGISLGGMSKALALAGLRIGWLATQSQARVERWQSYKDYTTICSSAPSEVLAVMALRACDTILARNLEIIRSNLSLAERFFAQHAGLFSWQPPQAGSVAFPRWLGRLPIEQFAEELVEQQGVMIVPGPLFDFPGSHFRLGLGRRNFRDAMERVEIYLRSFSG